MNAETREALVVVVPEEKRTPGLPGREFGDFKINWPGLLAPWVVGVVVFLLLLWWQS